MLAELGGQRREIIRNRPAQAFASAVWWCPFCDTSNQVKLHNVTGDPLPCGKCGAQVIRGVPVVQAQETLVPKGATEPAEVAVSEVATEAAARPGRPRRRRRIGP